MKTTLFTILTCLLTMPSSGEAESRSASTGTVVVTTSMLESAVKELAGPGLGLKLVRLIPPSSCPGHFDLNPRVLPDLRRAVLVLRHDYQSAIEERVRKLSASDVRLVSIRTPGSLLVPGNYLDLVDQVRRALTGCLPHHAAVLDEGFKALQRRLEATAARVDREMRSLRSSAAIVSANQKDFCAWLNLRVVAVFPRSEDLLPSEMTRLLSTKASLVVGNLQEGRDLAETLASRLDLPVAMLSNFPGVEGFGESYDELLDENLKRIAQACKKAWSN